MAILSAALIIFIAFILVPGFGSLQARRRWRHFRERVMRSALLPQVSFGIGGRTGPQGAHRFTGRIEALLGEDTLLLSDGSVTLRATMPGAEIFMLPDEAAVPPDARSLLEERFPEYHPQAMSWKRITSLQEGMKVYAVGFLESRDGVLRLYGSREVKLLAILHEGEDVVPRSVWSGRPKNGYWNTLTPWSLLAGGLALFVLATSVFLSQSSSPVARILLTGALFPIMPLLPPGLILFFMYLASWRRARFLRAEGDILGLSAYLRAGDAENLMAGWGDGLPRNTVPLIRSCRRRALRSEIIAGVAFMTGFGTNIFITMLLLNMVT